MNSKLIAYLQLMRFHKPVGIGLLLWPTLWALWIASQGKPPLNTVVLFIVGVIVMRAAGCVINDLADQSFDGHVQRTRYRPLVTGQVTRRGAIVLFAGLMSAAWVIVLQFNGLTVLIGFLAAALASVYPFSKRYLATPQVILGLAFASSVLMAFSALTQHLPIICGWLFVIVVLWTVIYDTQYAMVDRSDDRKLGIHSSAIYFGRNDRLIIGMLQILVIGLWLGLAYVLHLAGVFYIALLVAGGLFGYQQYLIRHRKPQGCFQAFRSNNWLGLIVFIGLCFSYNA